MPTTVVSRLAPALTRLAMAATIIVAIVYHYAYEALHLNLNPFNFFGYFTNQSNLFAAFVLAVTAVAALRKRRLGHAWSTARAAAATYMVVTFVVANTLLVNWAVYHPFTARMWPNDVVHRIAPAYLILDWLIFADRPAIRWNRLWLFFLYPVVWGMVTLFRGFYIDGFFAYPFLNPASVGASLPLNILALAVFIMLLSAGAIAVSRWRHTQP